VLGGGSGAGGVGAFLIRYQSPRAKRAPPVVNTTAAGVIDSEGWELVSEALCHGGDDAVPDELGDAEQGFQKPFDGSKCIAETVETAGPVVNLCRRVGS